MKRTLVLLLLCACQQEPVDEVFKLQQGIWGNSKEVTTLFKQQPSSYNSGRRFNNKDLFGGGIDDRSYYELSMVFKGSPCLDKQCSVRLLSPEKLAPSENEAQAVSFTDVHWRYFSPRLKQMRTIAKNTNFSTINALLGISGLNITKNTLNAAAKIYVTKCDKPGECYIHATLKTDGTLELESYKNLPEKLLSII